MANISFKPLALTPPFPLTLNLGPVIMSTIVHQQQPPPPITYASSSAHGSIGAVIAVLALVLILCVVAVVIGRLCSGRSIMGYGHYDMEGWVEAKCSSCVDGRILVFPPPLTRSGSGGGEGSSAPASAAETAGTVERQAEHGNVGS